MWRGHWIRGQLITHNNNVHLNWEHAVQSTFSGLFCYHLLYKYSHWLTCAGVSFWGARAVKARRTGGHAHPDLLHPNPLQVHEEARLAGQAAIVVRAGQTATLLAPRAHTRDLFWREQVRCRSMNFKRNNRETKISRLRFSAMTLWRDAQHYFVDTFLAMPASLSFKAQSRNSPCCWRWTQLPSGCL